MSWFHPFDRQDSQKAPGFQPGMERLEEREVPAIFLSSLSGYVYVDANNDGIFQSTETPISGATVALTGTTIYGASVNSSAITNSQGYYSFPNLTQGKYTLAESGVPSSYVDGKTTVGSQASGTAATDLITNITLPAGVDGVNNNFAELIPSVPPPPPPPPCSGGSGGSGCGGNTGCEPPGGFNPGCWVGWNCGSGFGGKSPEQCGTGFQNCGTFGGNFPEQCGTGFQNCDVWGVHVGECGGGSGGGCSSQSGGGGSSGSSCHSSW